MRVNNTILKPLFLSILFFVLLLVSCNGSSSEDSNVDYAIEGQTEEGFEDGTYCADVTYSNPNTGTENTYKLEVEVYNNEVIQINWNNGGWLDEDHFTAEQLDSDGSCSFTSDKGYDYTVEITGKNCGNLDSDDKYKSKNIPKYSFDEAVWMLDMTQVEIDELNTYSEDDVLSENDILLLRNYLRDLRAYISSMNMEGQYSNQRQQISNAQSKLQKEINEGYIQNIDRRTAYGVLSQTITIKKRGVNYLLEVRGNTECTMGTAQFNENESGWQIVYIKQNPNNDSWSGHSMRIIDSGF
jgi:hypothetical protein